MLLARDVSTSPEQEPMSLVTPNGPLVYVANYSASEVSVIDTIDLSGEEHRNSAGPRRLAITPGGDRIFASDYLGNSVSVIDTLTQTLIAGTSPCWQNTPERLRHHAGRPAKFM